jgi:DNA excision repair protein ERCC-2
LIVILYCFFYLKVWFLKRQSNNYYNQKFGKGWDYGYVLPAITKTLQNAGRCIRSEKDRGAIVFLDERYAWPQYRKCFPQDWNLKITQDLKAELEEFFDNKI